MIRCRHCGQDVPDYSAHLPVCVAVRAALSDDFWPGFVEHYRLTDAERAARKRRSHRAIHPRAQ